MSTIFKRLTMIAAREHEDGLLATLLEMQPALPGFTTMPVAGHGDGFAQASVHERVRGRIDRLLLWLVLPEDDVQRVLEVIARRLPHSQLVWWVEPVDAMGRLA
jgi:nitrogen regulatory protein PII